MVYHTLSHRADTGNSRGYTTCNIQTYSIKNALHFSPEAYNHANQAARKLLLHRTNMLYSKKREEKTVHESIQHWMMQQFLFYTTLCAMHFSPCIFLFSSIHNFGWLFFFRMCGYECIGSSYCDYKSYSQSLYTAFWINSITLDVVSVAIKSMCLWSCTTARKQRLCWRCWRRWGCWCCTFNTIYPHVIYFICGAFILI